MKVRSRLTQALRSLRTWLRALGAIARPRYTARVNEAASLTALAGGGQNLEPIADIVARAGRASSASD